MNPAFWRFLDYPNLQKIPDTFSSKPTNKTDFYFRIKEFSKKNSHFF